MAPFDVVEAYNKSIESWVEKYNPSSSEIFDKLALIGSFLLRLCNEVADRNLDLFPPYMRFPIDSKSLAPHSVGFSSFKFSSFDGDASMSRDKDQRNISEYYYLRRWMWMQFPWFAMKIKSELAGGVNEKLLADSQAQSMGRTPSASVVMVQNMGTIVNQSITSKSTRSDHMRGFWELKRLDPNLSFDAYQRVIKRTRSSPNRHSSPSLGMGQFSIMNFSLDSIKPVRKLKPLHKYRKSLKETLEGNQHTKFARPTLRSMHHNTLFPSVARDLLNRHIDLMKKESDPFELAAACARAGDDTIPIDLDLFSEVQDIYTQDNSRYADYPKEATVEEETANIAQLRGIFDKVHFVLQERRLLLNRLEQEYNERKALDAETITKLDSGEGAIIALEKKHEAVVDATSEAESMNSGFRNLLLICEQNPAQTKHHLNVVEKEVKLAKQQLNDLEKFRESMYADASNTDHEGSKFIVDQGNYYESMRLSTLVRKERQLQQKRDLQLTMLRNGFPKGDIDGYREFPDEEYVEEVARIREASHFSDIRSGLKGFLISKEFAKEVPSIETRHRHFEMHNLEDDSSAVESTLDVESSRSGEQIVEEYNKVVSGTNSKTVDELCVRYAEAPKLYANLSNQVTVAESKIVLMRSELSKLTNYYIDITLTPAEKAGKRLSDDLSMDGTESRVLDDKLVQAQLRLNQVVRQTENAESLLNEIRAGVSSLMSLLDANSTLMADLEQTPVPPLQSNSDIGEALAWCEEKIFAISEVLPYDTSRLAGQPSSSKLQKLGVTNEDQPLPERQVELALLMEGMLMKNSEEFLPRQSKSPHLRKHRKKGMGPAALQTNSSKPAELRTPRAVMVPPRNAIDTEFENRVIAIQAKQDELASQQFSDESFFPANQRRREALKMADFISSALSSHNSSQLLRQQRHACIQLGKNSAAFKRSQGWAIDSLVKTKKLESYMVEPKLSLGMSSKGKTAASRTKNVILHSQSNFAAEKDAPPSRVEVKQRSHALDNLGKQHD